MVRTDDSSPPSSDSGDTQQALPALRLSVDDDEHRPLINGVSGINGKVAILNGAPSRVSNEDALRQELEQTRAEKESILLNYHGLVSKVNAMKATLGDKFQRDAEELDRHEQQIQQLTSQNEDLQRTVKALQTEIVASNADAERSSKELELMRSRAFEEGAQESLARERELRETQTELEQCRIERDGWERAAQEARIQADEAKGEIETLKRELEFVKQDRARLEKDLKSEKEKTTNLQNVLEDFQMSKAHELRQAVRDIETQLQNTTLSLAEYKHRTHMAEMQLEESSADTSCNAELKKELKEKNLLIGKLRHEAVIMNEHLMEALRRLRKSSNDTNVDARLVTNVILRFLTTPRNDTKRFEMLNLLAGILSWNDAEREKAGLQRAGSNTGGWGSFSSPKGKGVELEKGDETESFSQMWVEFLLRESSSSASQSNPPTTSNSTGTTPVRSPQALPPLTPTRTTSSQSLTNSPNSRSGRTSPGFFRLGRLPSFTSVAMASQREGNGKGGE